MYIEQWYVVDSLNLINLISEGADVKSREALIAIWAQFVLFLQNFTLLLFEVKQNVFADFLL